jgi:uncharacterized membrane protein YhiD involved in acid resistance
VIEIIQKVGLNTDATVDLFLKWSIGIISTLATILLAIIAFYIKTIARKIRESIKVLADLMSLTNSNTLKIATIAEELKENKTRMDKHHDQILQIEVELRIKNK